MTAQKNFRVDSFVAGLAIKAPCVVETTAPITLSGTQTINSVAVVVGDRVLVKDQADASENGIYNVEASAWQRTADWDGNRDATNGTLVVVAGSTLVGIYQMTATNPVVIGTTDVTFGLLSTVDLAANLASTANSQGASLVAIEDAAGIYAGADVEAALAELGGYETGSFVTNWNGFTVALDSTWNYTRIGKQVTIHLDGTVTGTSNSNLWTSGVGEVPASIRPTENPKALIGLKDNGVSQVGIISVSSLGTMSFLADVAQNGFTASGNKQIAGGYVFTYLID